MVQTLEIDGMLHMGHAYPRRYREDAQRGSHQVMTRLALTPASADEPDLVTGGRRRSAWYGRLSITYLRRWPHMLLLFVCLALAPRGHCARDALIRPTPWLRCARNITSLKTALRRSL